VIPKRCPSLWAAAVSRTATVGYDHLRRRGRCLRRAQPVFEKHLSAAGLTFFPKSGHVLNLEEPALFNEMLERFIALVEAGRWGVRDPRSMLDNRRRFGRSPASAFSPQRTWATGVLCSAGPSSP
jgi:hypothetical protein